jgi:hypothetical protein
MLRLVKLTILASMSWFVLGWGLIHLGISFLAVFAWWAWSLHLGRSRG